MTSAKWNGTWWFGRAAAGLTLAVLAMGAAAEAKKPREKLLAAKRAAYEANFKNDARGLQAAAEKLDALVTDRELGAYALYYAGWTRWSLAAAQLQASDKDGAVASLNRSVEDLKKAVALFPENASSQSQAEFQCQLASSMISLAVVDGKRLAELLPEVQKLRKRALELAPGNPRVVMMDAGMIFNAPAQYGGSQEKGLERWLEAIRLFEAERIEDDASEKRGGQGSGGTRAGVAAGLLVREDADPSESVTAKRASAVTCRTGKAKVEIRN
jgi:hypothetical protein